MNLNNKTKPQQNLKKILDLVQAENQENDKPVKPSATAKFKKYNEDITDRKPPLWVMSYRNCFDWNLHNVNERFIEQFFTDLVTEARDNEDMLTLGEFYLKKGVPNYTFQQWVKRFEFAATCATHAKSLIGIRREKGALKKELDSSLVLRSMPLYDQDYKDLKEWEAKLTKESHSDKQINVMIQQVESSPLVSNKGEVKKTVEEIAKSVRNL